MLHWCLEAPPETERVWGGLCKIMEPKIGDKMKVSPQLTAQPDWVEGEVIDVEKNPFLGLVISIKDKLGRIFFGQSRYFLAL